MGYWKSKVLPKIKKVFEKDNTKKLAATVACKSFDDNKEEVNKEFEDKKTDLQPKVLEIYEASTTEIKAFIKDPKEAGLKKHSTAVNKLLEKLVEIEFPGSKLVSEASSKFGPALIPGPVLFVLEKVSTFIVVDAPAAEAVPEETTSKDVVIEAEPAANTDAATPEPPLKAAEEPEVTPPPKA